MTTPAGTKPADPLALLRTRRYLALLVLAAILGVPIAAIAYGFLKLVESDGLAVTPLVIVAVVVAYVVSVRLTPPAHTAPAAESAPAPAPGQASPAHGAVPPA